MNVVIAFQLKNIYMLYAIGIGYHIANYTEYLWELVRHAVVCLPSFPSRHHKLVVYR